MTDGTEPKLVARIANNSPIAFDTEFDDIAQVEDQEQEDVSDDVETPNNYVVRPTEQKEPEVPVLNQQPEEEEEEEEEEPQETQQPQQEEEEEEEEVNEELSEYSEAALAAMQLREMRENFEIPVEKDMGWEALIDNLDNYIAETINAGKEYQLSQIGQANKYVQFLLDGGSPEALNEAVKHVDLTNVDIDTAEEEQLKQIIKTNLELKGLSEDDINTVIETSKLQNKLQDKASNMQAELRERENEIMERDQQMRAYQKQQMAEQRKQLVNNINSIIESNEILGFPMDDGVRKELAEMIFKPTHVVTQVVDGKKVTKKMTGYEKMKAEFDNDLEKQLAFALWLMKGANFNSIAEVGEKRKAKSLMNELRKRERQSGKNMPRVKNAYLRGQ